MRIDSTDTGYSLIRTVQPESGKPFDWKIAEVSKLTAPSALPKAVTDKLTPEELPDVMRALGERYEVDAREAVRDLIAKIESGLPLFKRGPLDTDTAKEADRVLARALRQARKAKKQLAPSGGQPDKG